MKVNELYVWGYRQDRNISFLTNVIQTSGSNKAKKMKGLHKLVTAGKYVINAEFDLHAILIDGVRHEISKLEEYA